MPTVTTADGTRIYYRDWGEGQPVVLSHGWPLNADSWEAQMLYLAVNGWRVHRECIAAFSATDFRGDLEKFDIPTLVVIHGDDDQVVPFDVGGKASAAMIEGATLNVHPGAPHGITDTHKE